MPKQVFGIDRRSCKNRRSLERAKGLEPSTPTLARSCSTTELHPHPKVLATATRRQRLSYAKCAPRMQQFEDSPVSENCRSRDGPAVDLAENRVKTPPLTFDGCQFLLKSFGTGPDHLPAQR